MSRPLRLQMAQQRAQNLLRELGISELPVDPEAIAARHDIIVEAKPDTAPGVSGMLLRHGDTFGILYATHIESEGFRRFYCLLTLLETSNLNIGQYSGWRYIQQQ